jgi:hypothetical protein
VISSDIRSTVDYAIANGWAKRAAPTPALSVRQMTYVPKKNQTQIAAHGGCVNGRQRHTWDKENICVYCRKSR